MHRQAHAEHDGMKVWLSADEVEQFLSGDNPFDYREYSKPEWNKPEPNPEKPIPLRI